VLKTDAEVQCDGFEQRMKVVAVLDIMVVDVAAFCKVVVASVVFLSCHFQCRLLPVRIECDSAYGVPISSRA
jgi:hypothetical protein